MNAQSVDGDRQARTSARAPTWSKAALLAGFLALAAAVEVARRSPATGYEVSMYWATPVAFWIGIGVALTMALVVAVAGHDGSSAGFAFLLGSGALTAVVSLPTLRGYYFYGLADGLTHLGWTRAMSQGSLSPYDFFYPVGHLLAITANRLVGVELNRAMLLVVSVFAFLYFLFVTLCVRALVEETGAALVAAFVSFTLLPVFNVGTPLQFHPFTQGLLFAPVFVFLLVVYASRSSGVRESGWPVTAFDVLLLVVGLAYMLLHSQAFSDALILMGAIAGLQVLYRIVADGSAVDDHRLVIGPFVVLAALFLAWNLNHPALSRTVTQLTSALTGGSTPGAVVQQRGSSLDDVGSGLLEIFLKVYLDNLIVALFTAWLVATSLLGRSRERTPGVEAWTRYLFVGGIAVAIFAALHFFGNVSSYFFRHVGFGMVLLTLLGAVGIYYASRAGSDWRRAWPAVTVVGLVVLALSIAVFFPSPYIYTPNHHVTESQLSGYETAFEYQASGVEYAGVRGGAERYSEALANERNRVSEPIYGTTIRAGLPSEFDSDRYLIVTETDRQREIRAYRQIRVSRSDFRSLRAQVGVSRVQSGEGVVMYYVSAETEE